MKKQILTLLFGFAITWGQAQEPLSLSSSEIFLRLKKLNVLGNALYVAAHPDDENTRVIGYLGNGKLVNTAYLSMTRGDGGQNLIGPEIREQLGIIRTQELLSARRIDGGTQFFTRAIDFGYSKNTEETQRIWNRDEVLKDVVWTFRRFRPDVIMLRFPPDARAGHGHHTTSAILAREAFKLSGDPNVFPEQLKYVDPWTPEKIFLNTGRWWSTNISGEDEGVVAMDVGGYSNLLGTSYSEMAALSRSQHKSQGFGSSGTRGEQIEFMEYAGGLASEETVFDGIDLTWNRVAGSGTISNVIQSLIDNYDINAPHKSINGLIDVRKSIQKLKDSYWKKTKTNEIDDLLIACSGLYLESSANTFSVVKGDSISITTELTNRAPVTIELQNISINEIDQSVDQQLLPENKVIRSNYSIVVADDMPISNPYWLNKKGTLGMYAVDDLVQIGKPENDPSFYADITFSIEQQLITRRVPLIYKWSDRVKGEQRRRVEVIPPVMVSMDEQVVIFANNHPRPVRVKVVAGKNKLETDVALDVPKGWRSEPESRHISIEQKDDEALVNFVVYPPTEQSEVFVDAVAIVNGETYNLSRNLISYDHIPTQTLFPTATSKFVRLDIKKGGAVIGYLHGAGDAVPESLEAIGYSVWNMEMKDITPENLATLDAFVVGIRGVNTHPDLKNYKETILSFVENGGNVVYQFNTSRRINWEDFAPYELGFTGSSSDSRVSVEEAEIRILQPDHPVLNTPNKITSEDFEGWVQERGLYFPNKWAPEYEAVLSSNDPGEEPKDGGLLIAKHGEGYFIYSGYAWFRQLPAGVSGAYRLFTNIISLGKTEKPDNTQLNPDN